MSSREPDGDAYRLDIAYDGRAYYGWQRHGDKPTLQGAVEAAITACFEIQSAVHGSGRTDRGVHANGQVATAILPAGLDASVAFDELSKALPDDIQLLALAPAPSPDFHARASAKAKTYRYVIHNAPECPEDVVGRVWHIPGKLDVEAMRPACASFEGRIDFASFAKKTKFEQASTTRLVHSVTLLHDASKPESIEILIRADGFLWRMVRNIVRAIVKVGEGRTSVAQLQEILAKKDRNAAPGTAPASGLYLDSVEY
jgi:tRNA pseudouridine38-40 synthase